MYNAGNCQRMLPGFAGTAGGINAPGSTEKRQTGIFGVCSMDLGTAEFYLEVDGAESVKI